MPLHPAIPVEERILVFGPAGSGKTTNWLDIAKWSARTGSPARFFVLDTDFSVSRMLPSYPEVIPNVHLSTGYDWPDFMDFQKLVLSETTKEDWVVLDFVGTAWSVVQQYYVEEVFHQDMAEYFLQARKDLSQGDKSLQALDGWVDWSVINPLYARFIRPILFKGRRNIYATAQSDRLSSDKRPTEDTSTRALLLPYDAKPVGQKQLVYQFHSLLLTGYDPRSGERTITTVKDRERTPLRGQKIKSFTLDYLKNVAQWEMT